MRCCRVVFRNQVRFPTTIHVHGLLYNKSSEGSPYNDGTSGESAAGRCACFATVADLLRFVLPCHLERMCPDKCCMPFITPCYAVVLLHSAQQLVTHVQVTTRQMTACRLERHTSSHTMCQTALVPARLSPAARCGCALLQDLAPVSLYH